MKYCDKFMGISQHYECTVNIFQGRSGTVIHRIFMTILWLASRNKEHAKVTKFCCNLAKVMIFIVSSPRSYSPAQADLYPRRNHLTCKKKYVRSCNKKNLFLHNPARILQDPTGIGTFPCKNFRVIKGHFWNNLAGWFYPGIDIRL